MVTRTGSGRASSGEAAGSAPAAATPALPNVDGDFDELMTHRPVFRVRMQGYDRLEVDNYTAWAENELIAVRREVDHLLSRFAECSAELEISRRLIAEAPRGRETFPVSERVQQMLRLAADEAAAITEAGTKEADRLLAEARTEADARLRKAHEIKQLAVAAADELRDEARRDRGAAAAEVERARTAAAEILREAAAEGDRLAAQAAQERKRAADAAAARRAAVQAEVDELHRHAEQARQFLRALADRLGETLAVVADDRTDPNVAAEGRVLGDGEEPNVAAEGRVLGDAGRPAVAARGRTRDDREEPNVVVMSGRPAPIVH